LKTIEEPPRFVYFILATTEKNKIPDTIISRCINLNFTNIEDLDIQKRLEFICNNENIEFEKKALELIAVEAK
jgi:DNA polymerase III subunit gamma/tau